MTPQELSVCISGICGETKEHYAIIGMAHVAGDYPLYYDAVNEKGLGMAGLNFVGNAVYAEGDRREKRMWRQFEFIPWMLRQCATLEEAKAASCKNESDRIPRSAEQFPPAQLHWIIADENEAITVESVADGLHVYENPVGVLTNNPPFAQQMFHAEQLYRTCPRSSRRILSQKMFRLAPTAAEWVRWDFREISLPRPVLRAWRSRG